MGRSLFDGEVQIPIFLGEEKRRGTGPETAIEFWFLEFHFASFPGSKDSRTEFAAILLPLIR